MQYVRLGTSGLKISRICLGMMSYSPLARGLLAGSRERTLTEDEVARLQAPYRPHRVIGHS
jgi:aryl-alcohol dehydrogenase-like predicted oxidoreductase